ncbi:hypothetical protein R1sor_013444 [Riccia sorocarpa]|uniref:ABC transporter domain-containing protein n=1 Tax=Riccia sorocarpa TaxID=122646 RepID=A0ABD3H6K4_9MARC
MASFASSAGGGDGDNKSGRNIGQSRRSGSFSRTPRSSMSMGGSARWTNFGPDQTFSRGSERREQDDLNDEEALKWAALEKLPTYDRIRTTILENLKGSRKYREQVDLRLLGKDANYGQKLIQNLFGQSSTEDDNEKFLVKLRARIDKVGVELPKVEVRYEDLSIEAKAHVGGRSIPTLYNNFVNVLETLASSLHLPVSKKTKIPILCGVSGIVKPARLTLLLGPPASGKTTFLLALAGRLDKKLKVNGKVTYNGHEMHEFIPQKTSAYISQHDLHVAEMTVKETLEYSAKSQGVGKRYDLLAEFIKKEKELGIHPEPDIDFYMKATAMQDMASGIVTEYTLKILGLDVCADTLVGDDMIRGISGGQKKRVTTGEMIVGPTRMLLMDEISTGLDSSTTFQIVKCLKDICHNLENTVVMSLLQPPPETFAHFDDIILLSEGQIVYHGPRENVLEFFEYCGFRCPDRKGVADFLQEVTSRKDQEQYWADKDRPYEFVPVTEFAEIFKAKFHVGVNLHKELETPFDKSKSHEAALIKDKYSVAKMELLKINFEKEWLLLKRNAFVSIFRVVQLSIVALVGMSAFFRTEMHRDSFADAQLYAGAIFFGVIMVMFNGYVELSLTIARLPVFFKQRDLLFLPAWAFTIPKSVLTIPVSFYESLIWCVLTYYTIGFAPAASRFFKLFFLLFWVHSMSSALFRAIGALCRSMVVSNTGGTFSLLLIVVAGGFLIPRGLTKPWWIWMYWISPMPYITNGVYVNEFLSPQWSKGFDGSTEPGGRAFIKQSDFYAESYWYWIAVGVMVAYTFLFNFLCTIFLTYLDPIGDIQTTVSEEELQEKHANLTGEVTESMKKSSPRSSLTKSMPRSLSASVGNGKVRRSISLANGGQRVSGGVQMSNRLSTRESFESRDSASGVPAKRGMILPFQPLAISFNDMKYYVDMPVAMRQQGATESRLQLLRGITGAFRPGVLTALVGVSGAGKTTLMDVLAGRKTGGYIEGDIRIAGFPKKQETFARISGYCEQTDIHSPQVTVYESLIYSAWLRLPKDVSNETKYQFVHEVMELVELTPLRNAIVGLPAVSGLSTEQRKRLTIAVELVANPSIIFMDEPTSGLDARAAAIVMRTVRNTVDTGRTVVCTIHQPSIDIFEAFDELLLMKRGGEVIYAGPLGRRSHRLVEYFEAIPGVPQIQEGYNPATWMLEASSPSMELKLGVDFAEIYKKSSLYQRNKDLVEELSHPAEDAKDLYFPTMYSQGFFPQLSSLLWKQSLTYWRMPDYNNVRYLYTIVSSLAIGTMFWLIGHKRGTQRALFSILGGMYGATLFQGVNNASTVQPVVATERTVFYRERAAGMYSAMPYAIAQVLIEIPYGLIQSIIFSLITYSMMGLEWTAVKFFWYLFFVFFTFLYFTYYGMVAVGITPNQQIAMIVSTLFYGFFNLFAGFLIPRTRIPVWYIWVYWANPLTYSLYGIMVSQFGDVNEKLTTTDGTVTTVKDFVRDNFGYNHELIWLPAMMEVLLTVVFAAAFMLAIKKLNFQNR